jgi:hypothetical protein
MQKDNEIAEIIARDNAYTPIQIATELSKLVAHGIKDAVMLWGKAGIGKSSIVKQIADTNGIGFVDVRISQLAPTDLRGLPVADHDNHTATWYPPDFLPKTGQGIIFLDEMNMAPPTMQGIAQQLILDRRVGNYVVPDGWFVWAAGNRKEDSATVFDMSGPLANRFNHYEVRESLDEFIEYGLPLGLNFLIAGFLKHAPDLLHLPSPERNKPFPTPRAWMRANRLFNADLAIAPAVGVAVAGRFAGYCAIANKLPDLQAVINGQKVARWDKGEFVHIAYAAVFGLAHYIQTADHLRNAAEWIDSDEHRAVLFARIKLRAANDGKFYETAWAPYVKSPHGLKHLKEIGQILIGTGN